MDIRDKIRKLRKYHEISAKDFAHLSGVGKNTIQSIENKRHKPNIGQIIRMLDALGYELKIVQKESEKPLTIEESEENNGQLKE